MPMTVATVNVNGIRAATRKGMQTWIDLAAPEVITIQEVRAPDETLRELFEPDWFVTHEECRAKGRAGVAVLTRARPIAVGGTLDESAGQFENSGRWVEATVETSDGAGLTVVSSYVHTGDSADEARMSEKLAFMDAMIARLNELRATGRHVLLTGDLNVAHRELDIRNWRGNLGKAGFRIDERARLDELADLGWVDLGRSLAGDVDGPYTWWTYRGRAFDNDVGWRIDYQIASPELAGTAKEMWVHRVGSHEERWSDHAPVAVVYDL